MLMQFLLFVVGFVVLIKGADFFVDGASSLARNFKISKMLVGLTIVSFGTSAPEFAVSVQAMLSGSGDIILGNVIGSNILNILLILGVSALVHDLKVKNDTVKREIPIVLLLTSAFIVLMYDSLFGVGENTITRGDGMVILLFFSIFLYYLFFMMRHRKNEESSDKEIVFSLRKSLIFSILGIVATVIGSNLVVESATVIAKEVGISERIVGLTMIALGTSLPELVTSIVATKKGEYDIAIGNVVGSNIFNIGIVLGLPVVLFGNISVGTFHVIDLVFLFLSTFALLIFSGNDYKIRKQEAVLFLLMFILYYAFIII